MIRIRSFTCCLVQILTAVAVAGCASETQEVTYDSYPIAVESGAMHRGWLPLWLPLSSSRIYERHNLDTNASMWAAEVPGGTEIVFPSICNSVDSQSLSKPPFERDWWPRGVPNAHEPGHEYIYFKCGDQYVALAAVGGKLVGWTAQGR